jgi:hypothetical protein
LFGKNDTHFSGSCAQPKSRPGPLACEASHRIKEAGYRRKQERPLDRCQSGVQALDIPGKFMSAAWRRLRLRSNAVTARASQKRRGLPPPRQRSHRPKSAAARNSNRARRARLSQIYLTKFSVRFSDGKRLGKTEADVKSVRKKFLTFDNCPPRGAQAARHWVNFKASAAHARREVPCVLFRRHPQNRFTPRMVAMHPRH